jgi:hypothetical protein
MHGRRQSVRTTFSGRSSESGHELTMNVMNWRVSMERLYLTKMRLGHYEPDGGQVVVYYRSNTIQAFGTFAPPFSRQEDQVRPTEAAPSSTTTNPIRVSRCSVISFLLLELVVTRAARTRNVQQVQFKDLAYSSFAVTSGASFFWNCLRSRIR